MKRFSVCVAFVACVLAFVLGGCAPAAPAQSADAASLKGFWVLEEPAQLGFDAALNLDEGDLAELMMSDSYLEGSWTTDGKTASITFEGDAAKTAKVYLSDGKLTLGDADGSKLVFVKGDMESYFADQDDGQNVEVDSSAAGEPDLVEEDIKDVERVVLADDEICTIAVTGKGTDFTGDPGYRLSLTNNSASSIYVMADEEFKVDGTAVEPGMGEVVAAGKTVETFMYFPKEDLGGGVDKLKSVSGTLIAGDDESGDELRSYEVTID